MDASPPYRCCGDENPGAKTLGDGKHTLVCAPHIFGSGFVCGAKSILCAGGDFGEVVVHVLLLLKKAGLSTVL